MSVCANRTDSPGFFTPCVLACGGCRCAAAVRTELEAAADQPEEDE